MPYFPPAGGGAGDLVGPASSGDNALVRFDSTSGKLVQDSNATLSDAGLLTLTGGISPGGHSEPTADGLYDLGNVLGNLFRNINLGGGINASGYMHCRVGATSASASLKGAADGVLTLGNWNADDFSRLQFGGTTASFPALKRFNAVLHARLADDSGYCNFSANAIVAAGGIISNIWGQVSGKFYLGAAASAISSPADGTYTFFKADETSPGVVRPGAQTVATLPAAATAGAGAIAFVTDATATTPRSTVAGTGANFVMVMSDATNWLIVA